MALVFYGAAAVFGPGLIRLAALLSVVLSLVLLSELLELLLLLDPLQNFLGNRALALDLLFEVLLAVLELLLELLLDVARHILKLAELLAALRGALLKRALFVFADALLFQEIIQLVSLQALLYRLLAELVLELPLDLLFLHLAELVGHALFNAELGPQEEALFDVCKLLLRKVRQALLGSHLAFLFNPLAEALFNLLLDALYFLALVLQLAPEISVPRLNLLTDARVLVNLLFEPLKPCRIVKLLEPLARKINLPVYSLADDPLELCRSVSAKLLQLLDGVRVKALDALEERALVLPELFLEPGLGFLLEAFYERALFRGQVLLNLLDGGESCGVRVFAHFFGELLELAGAGLRIRIIHKPLLEPLD